MAKDSHLKLVAANAPHEIEQGGEAAQLHEVGRKGRLGSAVTKAARRVARSFEDTMTRFPGSSPVIEGTDKLLRTEYPATSEAVKGRPWTRDLFDSPIAEHGGQEGEAHTLNAIILDGTEVYGVVISGSKTKNSAKIRLNLLPYGKNSIIPSDKPNPLIIDEIDVREFEDSGETTATMQQSNFNVVIDATEGEETMTVVSRSDRGVVALDGDTFLFELQGYRESRQWQEELYTRPQMWAADL